MWLQWKDPAFIKLELDISSPKYMFYDIVLLILFHNSVIFKKKIWLNVQSRPGSVTDLCVVQVSIHVPALVSNKIRRTNLLIHDKKRRQHVSRTILYKICVMFLVDNATHLITLYIRDNHRRSRLLFLFIRIRFIGI